MAHFGSSDWPTPYGRVAAIEATRAPLTATGVGATEGGNLLTYAVVRTGTYRLSTHIKVLVASDATTATAVAQVIYNDGSAITTEDVKPDGLTVGTVNLKTLNANLSQTMVIRAVAGTNIVLQTSEAVAGTPTVGSAAYNFVIEAI